MQEVLLTKQLPGRFLEIEVLSPRYFNIITGPLGTANIIALLVLAKLYLEMKGNSSELLSRTVLLSLPTVPILRTFPFLLVQYRAAYPKLYACQLFAPSSAFLHGRTR